MLNEIGQGNDEDVSTARGLLTIIQSRGFVFLLLMFHNVLTLTNNLSQSLQGVQVDLAKAIRVLTAVKDALREMRSESSFTSFWEYVVNNCQCHACLKMITSFKFWMSRGHNFHI